jgi:phosphate uptake regulator
MDVDSPEYRKIQVLGRSSFAVTLPKSWVREMGLDSGSLVVVSTDRKGVLNIVPESLHLEEEETSEKVLEMKALSAHGALGEAIKACYKIGYETIRIRHPGGLPPEAVEDVHQAVESLYGTLIVSETPNETTLQSSIDIRTFTVKSLIGRMGSFFVYLSEEVERALREASEVDMRAVQYRAREVDKIYSLLVRQLVQGVRSQQIASRVGLSDVIQCLGSRMVAKALRDMTRSMFMVSGISEAASKAAIEDRERTAGLLATLKDLYRKAHESLTREDIGKAAEVLREQDELSRRLSEFETSLSTGVEQGIPKTALISIARELRNATQSVAILPEVAVNRYVERE